MRPKSIRSLLATDGGPLSPENAASVEQMNDFDLSPDERIRRRNAFQDWLGEKWLNETREHPVRSLWHRNDALAKAEIYTLGLVLERTKEMIPPKRRAEIRRHVIANDRGNRAGYIFEMICASMLHNEHHRATLTPQSKAGYDIQLALANGKRLRVSCKALIPSRAEDEFRQFMRAFSQRVEVLLPTGSAVSLQFELKHKEAKSYDIESLSYALLALHDQWRSKTRDSLLANGWHIGIAKLFPYIDAPFSRRGKSYELIAYSPHMGDEQRRFSSKIREAVENMHKHCNDVSELQTNLIFMRIPSSVSLDQAIRFLSEEIGANSPHIASVFVLRIQECSVDGQNQTTVGFVAGRYDNPYARSRISRVGSPGFRLTMTVPLGTLLRNEPVWRLYRQDGSIIDLSGNYVFVRGHHFHDVAMESSSVYIDIKRRQGVSLTCTFSRLAEVLDVVRFVDADETDFVLI